MSAAARKPGGRRGRLPAAIGASEMAALLGITPRSLQQLVRDKVLPRTGRDAYPIAEGLQAFLEFVAAKERRRAATSSTDRLRDQRRAEIVRRMQREDHNLIQLDEALDVLDVATAAFLAVVDELPAKIGRNRQERRQVGTTIAGERDRLAVGFTRIRSNLRVGTADAVEEE